MVPSRPGLPSLTQNVRNCWKQLVLADITYKIIAFVLLAPLVGLLFRILVAASGRSLLADLDILFFFLRPLGWISLVAVGALWLGIIALEQAALLAILAGGEAGRHVDVVTALRFATAHLRPVLLVTARLLLFTLLVTAPFLAVTAGVYFFLLGEYDINFYLKTKPPEFWVAVSLAVVIITVYAAILVRLLSNWFYALPIVLFEDVAPAAALRISTARVAGHRPLVVCWIVTWAIATSALSALGSSAVVLAGRMSVPYALDSLWLLSLAVGGTVGLWAIVTLAVNLVSTIALAAMLFQLYRQRGNLGELNLGKLKTDGPTTHGAGWRLTRIRLVVASLVGLVLAATVGALALGTVQLEDHTQVTAHRGTSAAAPENTMAAVLKAIEDQADWVEIDVQETADGEVVVFHDSDFMKLAGKKLKIWDATLADLQQIDIGSWFGPQFKDERVPTLDAVLGACRGKVGVNIELKYYGHDQQLEQRVIDLVERHGMERQIVCMSLKPEAVQKMKTLRPSWKMGLLMSVSAGGLDKISADFLAVNAGFVDRRFVRAAHARGQEVQAWTVNDAPTMSRLISRGVDNLITDQPALARAVLQQRATMSVPERGLLELANLLGVAPNIVEQ